MENLKFLILRYLKEVLDAFIAVMTISYISPKIEFNHKNVAKTSVLIGTMLFFLKYYDEELCKSCKSSMYYSLGNSWA